ncbi:MAG: DapH/DapD/GlmU-related protein [Brevundimonas sp.]|nr:DapH/DapD/GlmU-related protein [Brevundimonas sp.]
MIHLIGAGGHGKVVIDAWLAAGGAQEQLCVRDGRAAMTDRTVLGLPVLSPEIDDSLADAEVHVAIGDNTARAALITAALAAGARLRTIRHPSASVSAFADIGDGGFIGAGVVIGPDASTGQGVIVCAGAVIDHDSRIGDHAFIGPGAVVASRLSIGPRAVVRAGAVVTRDLAAGEIWPAPPASSSAGLHIA